jgi:hypothetical protein
MTDAKSFCDPVEIAFDETHDEFSCRRFAMEDQVKVVLDASGSMDVITSVFKMPLPFCSGKSLRILESRGIKPGARGRPAPEGLRA